jgi:hypothetical protein
MLPGELAEQERARRLREELRGFHVTNCGFARDCSRTCRFSMIVALVATDAAAEGVTETVKFTRPSPPQRGQAPAIQLGNLFLIAGPGFLVF